MFFIVLISALCLWIVQKIIIIPLDHLSLTIQKISDGDLTQKVGIVSNDEIGQLGEAFNQMTTNLREFYSGLEDKVQQRTKIMNKTLQELQRSNNDLKQMQAQLFQSEKLAAIGQLAAGVAHEINNPVGFISNNIEILKEYIMAYKKITQTTGDLKRSIEDQDLEKARSIIEGLTKLEEECNIEFIKNDVDGLIDKSRIGIERIKKIVLDLRVFARQDSEDAREIIKIEEVIEGILGIVHSELKYKAEVIKEYTNTTSVKCNQQRMGQVFINLFINAAQAIKERGKIIIRTYQEDRWVCVDISDTGQGIPQENLKKIFDPFFTTKPVGKGTGLGLSVCHEIIAKHQGEIVVRSKVGEGTTFTVKLPIV
jgi:signal transduction histidine kinase